jgi:Spy/CpxP family protein refolding chaperone
MANITRKIGTMTFVGLLASLIIVTFAADAGAQHGEGMMMGSCAMCGRGASMMPMGGAGHGARHPSSASLMRMLHQWAQQLCSHSDYLELNEKQLDEIESIFMSHIKYATRKKADPRLLLLEMQELLLKEEINTKQVEKKLKAMESLNTDMAMEGVETLKKVLAVLTPQQQKKARSLFKKSTLMGTMGMGMMPGGMMHGMMRQGGTPAEGK